MLPVWKFNADFFHREKRLRSKNSSSAPRLEETRSEQEYGKRREKSKEDSGIAG
jgi:hypothetical protein